MAADRKSLVQVKFRLRKDVLKRLQLAAKTADRSVNDEIGRRLEQSIVASEVVDHYEKLVEIAAEKAADRTATKVIEALRHPQDQTQDQGDLAARFRELKAETQELAAKLVATSGDAERGKS